MMMMMVDRPPPHPRLLRPALAAVLAVCMLATMHPVQAQNTFIDTFSNGSWTMFDPFSRRSKMSTASRLVNGHLQIFAYGDKGPELYVANGSTIAAQGFTRIYPDPPVDLTLRFETRLEIIGNRLFLATGGGTGFDYSRDVFVLNLNAPSSWSKLSPTGLDFPDPARRTGSWVAASRYMVFFGGFTPSGVSHRTWAFDTVVAQWQLWNDQRTGANTPGTRLNPCCASVPGSDNGVCFGGTSHERVDANDVWEFIQATKTWVQRPARGDPNGNVANSAADPQDSTRRLPKPRRLAVCTTYQDSFIINAGYEGKSSSYVNDSSVWVFNLTTNQWRQQMHADWTITCRDHAAMTAQGDQVFYWSGALDDTLEFFNDLYQLSVTTFTYTRLQANFDWPQPRHNILTAQALGEMWVFFGSASDGSVVDGSDVWAYNVYTNVWTKKAVVSSAVMPAGRAGACGAVRGNVILVFGGFDGSGTALSDIWQFNLRTLTWKSIDVSSSSIAPSARAHPICFFNESLFVVGGGHRAGDVVLSDWFAWNFVFGRWQALAVTNAGSSTALTEFRGGTVMRTRTDGIALALGRSRTFDLSNVYDVQLNREGTAITLTHRPSVVRPYPDPSWAGNAEQYRLQRWRAVAASGGSEFLVCSGHNANAFAPLEQETCVSYSYERSQWLPAPQLLLAVSSAGGAYIGGTFVMFGGKLTSDGLRRSELTSATQLYTIDDAAKCSVNPVRTDGCLLCSAGTVHPTCTPAPAGTYVAHPGDAPRPCPRGTYSTSTGLTSLYGCIQCPRDTYNNVSGATACTACPAGYTCSIGTIDPVLDSVAATSGFTGVTSSRTTQIPAFHPLNIPNTVYMGLAGVVFLFIVFTAVTSLSRMRNHTATRNTFFSTDAQELIRDAYERHKKPGFGLDAAGFVALLAEDFLHPHKVSGPQALQMFDEFDVYGSTWLSERQTFDLLTTFAIKEIMPSLENYGLESNEMDERREAVKEQIKRLKENSWFTYMIRFDIAKFDLFADRHVKFHFGEPLRLMKTSSGALLSLVSFVCAMAIMAVLIGEFFFRNTTQTEAAVPAAVIRTHFDDPDPTTDYVVQAAIRGVVMRSLDGRVPVSPESACVDSTGACVGTVSLYIGFNVSAGVPVTPTSVRCEYDPAERTCQFELTCIRCSASNVAPVRAEFTFAPDYIARAVRIYARVTSGIRNSVYENGLMNYLGDSEESSELFADVYPPSGLLLAGKPATTQQIELTPTYFETAGNSFSLSGSLVKRKGVVLFNQTGPATGNVVDNFGIDETFGVPVHVVFVTADTALMVARRLKQTEFELIALVFGGVAGVASLCVLLMQALDSYFLSKKDAEKFAADEKQRNAFEELQHRDETDPHFVAATDKIDGDNEPFDDDGKDSAAADSDDVTGSDAGDSAAARAEREAAAAMNAEQDDVVAARNDYLFRRLLVSDEHRKLVAGLIAAGTPLHVALEMVKVVETIANAGERERQLQAPQFPNVDRFLTHSVQKLEDEAGGPAAGGKDKSAGGRNDDGSGTDDERDDAKP